MTDLDKVNILAKEIFEKRVEDRRKQYQGVKMKMIAMYYMQTTSDVPAFIGLFSDSKKAAAFLDGKDKRKYYTRDYVVDALLS